MLGPGYLRDRWSAYYMRELPASCTRHTNGIVGSDRAVYTLLRYGLEHNMSTDILVQAEVGRDEAVWAVSIVLGGHIMTTYLTRTDHCGDPAHVSHRTERLVSDGYTVVSNEP